MLRLILASTSPYRRELLQRLAIPFESLRPLIDEEKEKRPQWSPRETAEKLAELKAASLAGPTHLVIGGDQLVSLEGRILGKPGNREKALTQLESMQGRTHELITAVCVISPTRRRLFTDVTRVTLKKLSRGQLEKIVDLDEPFDCAGSYKIEKHGIALIDRLETEDFTAIQGLPLLQLAKVLETEGLPVP